MELFVGFPYNFHIVVRFLIMYWYYILFSQLWLRPMANLMHYNEKKSVKDLKKKKTLID